MSEPNHSDRHDLAREFREAVEAQLNPKHRPTIFLQTIDNRLEELEMRPVAHQNGYVKLRVAGEDQYRWVMDPAWRAAQDNQRIHNQEGPTR